MVVLGIMLLAIGLATRTTVLSTVGTLVIIAGLALMIVGATGRAVLGRRYWY